MFHILKSTLLMKNKNDVQIKKNIDKFSKNFLTFICANRKNSAIIRKYYRVFYPQSNSILNSAASGLKVYIKKGNINRGIHFYYSQLPKKTISEGRRMVLQSFQSCANSANNFGLKRLFVITSTIKTSMIPKVSGFRI